MPELPSHIAKAKRDKEVDLIQNLLAPEVYILTPA